jgi:CheY-like chemotaxis protein
MAGRPAAPSISVLLVEEDPGDALMISEAFRQCDTASQLHLVSDGVQAMKFLRRAHGFTEAPRPALIVLGLKLPRRDGLEVLTELKNDSDLRTIPVVVLSSSRARQDIQRCYWLHANAYVIKPADFDGLAEVIGQIAGCFLRLIELSA